MQTRYNSFPLLLYGSILMVLQQVNQIQKDWGSNMPLQDEGRIFSIADQNYYFIQIIVSMLTIYSWIFVCLSLPVRKLFCYQCLESVSRLWVQGEQKFHATKKSWDADFLPCSCINCSISSIFLTIFLWNLPLRYWISIASV